MTEPKRTQPLWRAHCFGPTTTMGKRRDPARLEPDAAALQHDPATLRRLADEADGQRHRTAFGHLDDTALLRAMAAALRAYADAQEGREPAQRFESGDKHAPAA
jgi:hypothetical protein